MEEYHALFARKIEEKRGVVVNEVEPVSLDMKTMALSGPARESVKATGNGTESNSASWDADWTAPKKAGTTTDNGLFPKKSPPTPTPGSDPCSTSDCSVYSSA